MIDFLSPLWLIATAAAAIPLFIHLLRRRTGARVDFPAVRYLARAEREHSRKLRLRNLLLMLLRVAAILLVAAAAARPVLRVGGGGHAPTALAVVLDNSLSTSAIVGGRPVLEDLRARAAETVRRASADDRVWLVTADGAVHGGGRAAVLDAISRVGPLAGAGDIEGAVTRAAALAGEAPLREREMAIFTDGQATSWPATISSGRVRVRIYRAPGDPPANRAVVEAEASPFRWTPRGAVLARVLTNDSATYRIALEGRTLARGTAAVNEEVMVRASPPERGWTAGSVELEPDELRGDDARYFAVWIGPPPGVRVLPSAGVFVASAVDALIGAERVTAGKDVTVVPVDQAATLPALLIAPSDPVRVGAANRALERLDIPWRLGSPRRGESAVRFQSSAASDSAEGVNVTFRYSLTRGAGAYADTLATTAGQPWIVSGPGYVLIASPVDPSATNFPVRASFVPWLGDIFSQRLSAEPGTVSNATPGSVVARPAGADALELAAMADSARSSTLPLHDDSLPAPDRAGVYFFMRGGERAGALAVNPQPAESQLRRLELTTLASRVRADDVRAFDRSGELDASVFASAPRRPLVFPLLILALAALLTESVVAGGGWRRSST
ncbi:MAG TPA: BatA and WFA domain-containing protein [Gemmatimonadaceae bacterium]|nr:BatA and WFA domain-containing protein [Gemmatimonadaceae bacterium]